MMLNGKTDQVKNKKEEARKVLQSCCYVVSASDSFIKWRQIGQKQCTSLKKHCRQTLNKQQTVS